MPARLAERQQQAHNAFLILFQLIFINAWESIVEAEVKLKIWRSFSRFHTLFVHELTYDRAGASIKKSEILGASVMREVLLQSSCLQFEPPLFRCLLFFFTAFNK